MLRKHYGSELNQHIRVIKGYAWKAAFYSQSNSSIKQRFPTRGFSFYGMIWDICQL